MSTSSMVRVSGLGLVAGSGAFSVYILLLSFVTSGPHLAHVATTSAWLPLTLFGLAAACTVLAGLPGSYARIAGRAGALGFAGVVLVGVAWSFFGVFLSLYASILLPWLAVAAPGLVAPTAQLPPAFILAFVVGLLLWCAGAILLALGLARSGVAPRWWGYALVGSGLWSVIGDVFIAPRGPAPTFAINLLSNLGPLILMLVLADLGLSAWRRVPPAAALAAPEPASLNPGGR